MYCCAMGSSLENQALGLSMHRLQWATRPDIRLVVETTGVVGSKLIWWHHSYGVYSDFDRYAATKHSTPHLRTLLFFKLDSGSCGMPQVHFISKCFKLLRVLDFEGIEIGSLPSSFGKLTHLRYLGLRGTGLETLPTSIGNLRSLQTMDTSCLK